MNDAWEIRRALAARLRALFDTHVNEYGKFDLIVNKRSNRPDLHAFLLLDELAPNPGRSIVCYARDGEIVLEIDPDLLAPTIHSDQVLELVRCGVSYGGDSFTMFT